MAQNTIELKSVYDLSGKSFHIGSYQRGYRWTETQVNDLLNDIKSFSDTLDMPNTSNAEFYCLQPIVVKNIEEDKWEVIDGQQRLTTLFLILKKLEEFTNIIKC